MSAIDHRPSASSKLFNGLLATAGAVVGLPLVLAGNWIAYSTLVIDHQVPLPPAIEAERNSVTGTATTGRLSYYVDRTANGRPLLLIHSVNAAASAYEMRPIFEHYRGQRPTYAPDLPGYGFSERSDQARSPEAYAQALLELVTQIGEPVDAIALSLGCEFAARAALQQPDRFHSLTLISPSGFNASGTGRATQQAPTLFTGRWPRRCGAGHCLI